MRVGVLGDEHAGGHRGGEHQQRADERVDDQLDRSPRTRPGPPQTPVRKKNGISIRSKNGDEQRQVLGQERAEHGRLGDHDSRKKKSRGRSQSRRLAAQRSPPRQTNAVSTTRNRLRPSIAELVVDARAAGSSSRSVTSCRPRRGRSRRSRRSRRPACASAPSSDEPPAPRAGRSSAPTQAGGRRAARAGCESRTVSGLDQEVEDHDGDAEDQQRGVGAQRSRSAARAPAAEPARDDAGRAADERAVDEDALEGLLAEAAEPGDRAHDERRRSARRSTTCWTAGV